MKNWVLANDYGDEYLLNINFIISIDVRKDCNEKKYLNLSGNQDFEHYQWSFQSNEECELKYKELIQLLTK